MPNETQRLRMKQRRCLVGVGEEADEVDWIAPEGVDTDEVSRIADAVNTSRDLINTPTNDMGPEQLEEAARVEGCTR